MAYKIIGDSCTDLTKEMKQEGFVSLVPLTLTIEDEDFVDDEIGRIYKIIDSESFAFGLKDYLEEKISFMIICSLSCA